jgi:hypothetical protein
MRNIRLVAVLLLTSACAPGTHHVDWPKVVQCVPNASGLLQTVANILMSGDSSLTHISDSAKSQLEQLAVIHGAGTIACLVEQLAKDWTAQHAHVHAAQSLKVRNATARAHDFLTSVGTSAQFQH